ncbi:MAG: hypothetical protein EOP73_07150 [Variovorax sp.]|jgi:hypothetical protein|nr:MAG: hypothetical protein EOP73_07150 [Variovorax sp.]
MSDIDQMSRDELWALACEWRRRALRGDKSAHGPAHLHEVAWRRRFGEASSAAADLKELRPLAVLATKERWRPW